jgi:hypothetical protein
MDFMGETPSSSLMDEAMPATDSARRCHAGARFPYPYHAREPKAAARIAGKIHEASDAFDHDGIGHDPGAPGLRN